MAGKQLSLIKYQKHKPASTLKKLTPKERLGKVNESVIKSSLTKACNELGLTLIWSGQEAYKKGLTNQQKHDADFKVYYTDQIDNEPDKFDIDKDIKRAKECGLFDDYGFSS